MASSENNSDEGGTAADYEHMIQIEYLKEKYREVVSKLKSVSNDKERLEKDYQLTKKELETNKGDFFNTCHDYNMLKQKYDNLRLRFDEFSNDPPDCTHCEELKKEIQTVYSERESVFKDIQCLERKLQAAVRCRDDSLKNCAALQEKIELLKKGNFHTNDGGWNRDRAESKDKFEIVSENLESASREIERLKKALDKAKAEIARSVQETEIAKGRRDWAISEREKIVQERDSVRNLCDEIRKERDTATSKLLAAIRDKDEACKEIEQLTERLDSHNLMKDNLANNNTNPGKLFNSMDDSGSNSLYNTSSLDSVYDLDTLLQYDTKVIEIDSSLLENNSSNWGLILRENIDEYNDNNVKGRVVGPSVLSVEHNSVFFGRLLPNDIIYQIDGLDCTKFPKRKIFKAIRCSLPSCIIMIKRPIKRLLPVQVNYLNGNKNHGLHLETGIFVSKIEPNSLVDCDGRLSTGDRIISINGKPTSGIKTVNEINAIINDMTHNCLSLIVVKDLVGCPSDIRYFEARNKLLHCSTSSTQTENIMDNIGSAHREVFNQVSLDLENNHFLPSAMPFSILTTASTPSSIIASTPTSSKSASKLTGMLQKLKDKMNISTHKDCQENDAIAALDSVLDSDDQESNLPMYSKNRDKKTKKKSKDSQDVPRGTWPRVTMTVHSNDNHVGTVLHRPKRERPKLSIPVDKLDSSNYYNVSLPTDECGLITPQSASNNPTSGVKKRNSNPSSNFDTSRIVQTSKYGYDFNASKSGKFPHSRTFTYDLHNNAHISNINRHSLNLSSLNKQQLQHQHTQHLNTTDYMPRKSNNSIDSTTLPSKNPTSYTFSNNISQKDPLDCYLSTKISKHSSKYSSDTDSIDIENVSLTMALHTHTMPHSHSRRQSISNTSNASSTNKANSAIGVSGMSFPNAFNSSVYSTITPYHQSACSPQGGSTMRPASNVIPSTEYTILPQTSHHSQGSSIDYPFNRYSQIQSSKEEVPSGLLGHSYEGGTFPRNKVHQGYRIPSNQSVTSRGSGIKISNGSIDYCSSGRASPIPTFHVQVIEPGRISTSSKRTSLQDYNARGKPNIGEVRRVHIDKSEMSLGIKICSRGNGGGVFVSNVGENSLASKVGLQIGDRLLEVCGINLRKATYDLAANVLRQCGNSITMLVQYNPEIYSNLTTSEDNIVHSSSPTPQNSPRTIGRAMMSSVNTTTVNPVSTIAPKTLSSNEDHPSQMSSSSQSSHYKEQPRLIFIETRKSSNLGISLVGGNANGIFVHGVQKDSIADNAGLRVGDQILEFNGTDLRRSTAEHAALEIAKPAENVAVLVFYNIQKFNQIKDKPGDALYIRVGFDRNCDLGESELPFNKDEVLYVDNTMFGGVPGRWRAWKLDEYGHKLQCGIIPNKLKVEEELRLFGDIQDVETTRRGSTSARRSFFKRIKPQRSSSRDSKELASFSNTHLSLYLETGNVGEDGFTSYQRVERLEYKYRPILIVGPLSECVIEKLCIDFPEHFHRSQQRQMRCTKEDMESGVQNNAIADYRRRGSIFEYTTIQSILENKQHHYILDVCISAVERLQRNQIYPIVLLLRFKSSKQIKEIKDSRHSTDKISAKAAKEMYEHALKLESDYRQYISVVISGVNIAHMCTQIKSAVDSEQKKLLWVPVTTMA